MSPDRTNRLAGIALLASVVAFTWAALLALTGGVQFTLSGRLITSHNPMPPVLAGALAFSVYMLAGGDERVVRSIRGSIRATAIVGRWLSRFSRSGYLDRTIVVIAVTTAVVLGIMFQTRAAAGSDVYGYISEAEMYASGHLSVPQPWVKDVPWPEARQSFEPLGWTPAGPVRFTLAGYAPAIDEWSLVPVYSPGLPLMMAAAKLVAGTDAVFWVVPITGALLLLATYGLGCRLGSRRLGTSAMFLLAAAPTFAEFHFSPVTEVPVAAAWTGACWCVLGQTKRSAVLGAFAMAAAILIRPNLVPLGLVIGAWLALRVWFGAPHRRHHVVRAAILLSGLVAGALVTAAMYWKMYGTPFESGYGDTRGYFSLGFILPNIVNYHGQFAQAMTPIAYAGLLALFIPVRRLWPGAADRYAVPMLGAFCLVLWAEFWAYQPRDAALRFLLPSFPFIMLGLSSVALMVARSGIRGAGLAAAAAVLVLGLYGFDPVARKSAFGQWQGIVNIDAAELVERATPSNSVILTLDHSGTLRYYAGRMTLRWDWLRDDWLDRSVAWLGDRGYHSYALIDAWERPLLLKRFEGQALRAVFEQPPVFRFGSLAFYDLGLPPGTVVETTIVPMHPVRRRAPASRPFPSLEWRPR